VQPGERIDHYRLVSLVGVGGMGEVYRAVDERLRRDVAIKVLPRSTEPAQRETRLLREAQAASHLNHPGIVTIHDVGRWDNRTYIVMELVDGRRLSELAQAGIDPVQAVALCRQAAEAMAVAHERGILHRDIKPDNLMVTRDDRVKSLDFGVAKVYDPNASVDAEPVAVEVDAPPVPALSHVPELPPGEGGEALDDTIALHPHTPSTISVTKTGALLGTPAYMSPEQAAGAPVDERSEVYSLGLVLYELLTGVRPLQRATLIETLASARDPSIAPASAGPRGRGVPRGCDRLLARALARAPAGRHPTMRALADDLRQLEASLSGRGRPGRGRRWLPIALVLAIGAVGVAIAIVAIERSHDRPATAPAIAIDSVRRLTFDPGCEELPYFWPDGSAVVFDGVVDGDTELIRLDLATGARHRLTRNPGWDIGGAVSPDGRLVSFVRFTDRGRELMVLPWSHGEAGAARSVGLTRGYPTWTADGKILIGDDQGRMLRVDPDRGAEAAEVIASRSGFAVVELDQMASGELLFAVRRAGQDPNRVEVGVVRAGGRVEMMDLEPTVDSVGIARDAGGHGFYYAEMSPTGPRLYWRSLAGGDPVELQAVPFPYGGVSAARGGTRLVLSTCRQVFQVGRLAEGDRFAPFFTGSDWSDLNVAALADGAYVFASDRSGETQIWTGRPGEAPHLLVHQPSNFPTVSPDGRRLAWIAPRAGEKGLYVSGVDGAAPRRLTRSDGEDQPRFASDGESLFVLRGGPEGSRVVEIPIAGGEARPVTPPGAVGYAVSPIGRGFAWLDQTADGRYLMVGQRGDDGVRVPGLPSGNYTSITFSRDGKKIWLVRGGTEVIEVSPDGATPPVVVWRTANDLIGFIAASPDGNGIIGDVASYEGDIYLVEGRFR
jgi:serine/threonine protein kinase